MFLFSETYMNLQLETLHFSHAIHSAAAGQIVPTVDSSAFLGSSAKRVMTTLSTFLGRFGNLEVCRGTAVGGCLPMPMLTFTESNAFSNTFIESNEFSLSWWYNQKVVK